METQHNPDIESWRVDRLFPHLALDDAQLVPPHHPGQASYIWAAHSPLGPVIIRTSRFSVPPDEDFWQGSLRLFGVDTRRVERLQTINRWLRPHLPWPVPQIIAEVQHDGRTVAALERLSGAPLQAFDELSDGALEQFGAALATLHRQRFMVFGPPAALDNPAAGFPLSQFPNRVRATVSCLLTRFYPGDRAAWHYADRALRTLQDLPPLSAAPILLDMDPSQYLARDHAISGLVDTELYVLAPPELELAGLEFLLHRDAARRVQTGYRRDSEWPPLTAYRLPYRFLLRLLSFQGSVPWEDWMHAPTRFED